MRKSLVLKIILHLGKTIHHMSDSTKPQQNYAGTGENCNFKTPSFFTLPIKLFENLYAYYLSV